MEHEDEKLNLMKASIGIRSEPEFRFDAHLLTECTRDLRHVGDRESAILPAMRYSQCDTSSSYRNQCFHEPTPILQMFNMKVIQTSRYQEHVTGVPVEVYGFIAVRDSEDYCRNYLADPGKTPSMLALPVAKLPNRS